jgi:hypothetical protein
MIQVTLTTSLTVEPLEGDLMVVLGGVVSFLSSQEKKNNRENINQRRFIQKITNNHPTMWVSHL